MALFLCPLPPLQDFNIEMRIDYHAVRNGDKPQGANPVTVLVRDGQVDLSDMVTLVGMGKVPAGKPAADCMQRVLELAGYSVRDFVVALFNLAQSSHMELAYVLFSQA